jgi:hypothetical protein
MYKETIKNYLDGLLAKKLVSSDRSGAYIGRKNQDIYRISLGAKTVSFSEQSLNRTTEFFIAEHPYDESTLEFLRSRLGN